VSEDDKTLSETTLTSPVAGTVTALDGSVGESVSGSGSSASSSTGSTSSSGTSSSSTGTASTGSSSSSSSSSSFITITDLGQLEVVAGFAEADISNIKIGQPATITLAALTNVELTGKVTAVAPTSTVSSNVVTYDVTIAVDDPPSNVKIGMTADVSVITASKTGVLEVPSAAVTTTGTTSTVTLLQGGKQTTKTVVLGLVGSSTTQILSGVSAGQVLVEPTATTSSGTSSSTSSSSTSSGSLSTGGLSTGGFGGGAP
jgi:multidrug efflux pump subunit AcrA (membrane-fusion protein)